MRPLVHPALEDITVEGILHALSDPVRVEIFTSLAGSPCSQTCGSFLEVGGKSIPKSTLSQHLKVLRESGLTRQERHGVEIRSTSRCTEIDQRFPGLIPAIVNAHAIQSKSDRSGRKKAKRLS